MTAVRKEIGPSLLKRGDHAGRLSSISLDIHMASTTIPT